MDFKLFSFDEEIETNDVKISARKIKISAKNTTKLFLKKEKANEVFTEIPKPGESIHIVSNGSFDYFNLIPICVDLMKKCNEFYFSTWTMNRQNVEQLFKLYDENKIKTINGLVGLYFKTREPQVFNDLYEGILKRGQKVFSNENHSKITLLENGKDFISICGSANFTANPRIEQFTVSNDKQLYEFHKGWMDEILQG